MSKNAYFSFGIMSTLASSIIAKRHDNNCLVLEQSTSRDECYLFIEDTIIDCFSDDAFNEIFKIDADHTLRDLNYLNVKETVRLTSKYKRRSLSIDNYINDCRSIFSPLTSRIAPLYIKQANSATLIEHGLGEYLYLNRKERYVTLLLKKAFDIIYNYFPIGRYYCDSIMVVDSDEYIERARKGLDSFWKTIQLNHSTLYEKVEDYFKNRDEVVIYLLPPEIKTCCEAKYRAKVSGRSAIIRAHPSVKSEDDSFFSDGLLRHIPSEFFVYFSKFSKVTYLGTASSSLFYAKRLFGANVELLDLSLDDVDASFNINDEQYASIRRLILKGIN